MRSLRGWLVAMFTVGGFLALSSFNAMRPRVMVLHSGSEESLWVQDVDRGMTLELQRDRRPVQLSRHYLRLDKPGASPESVRLAIQDAERAIGRARPDILVAVDDEANALVARKQLERSGTKVLYVSIDQPPAAYGYESSERATGISEELPLAAVRDALSDLRGPGLADLLIRSSLSTANDQLAAGNKPVRLRVAAVAHDSETGRAELDQVAAFDWSPHLAGPIATASDWGQWQAEVRRLAGEAEVILVLSYHGLPRTSGSADLVSGEELADWMENESERLPVGLNVGYVVDGGGFSIAPAPLGYGEEAMRMTLQWLNPARQGRLPKAWRSGHFDVALRAGCLTRRGLSLPPIYAEAARMGNDFYEE